MIVASKDKSDIEFGLTIAAIPVTIVLLILAGYFTRKETKLGIAAIIVSPASAPALYAMRN